MQVGKLGECVHVEEFFGDRLFNALERNEPKAGMLLVAAPGMNSSEFERSVVLIVEHGPDLTFGVDLSKRSDYAVYNAMPEWTPYLAKPQAFYIGGPVNQETVVAIGVTKSEVVIEEHPELHKLANRIVHITFSAEPEDVGDLLEGARLFVGFARWGARIARL